MEAGAELNISNDFIWPLHQPENGTIVVFLVWAYLCFRGIPERLRFNRSNAMDTQWQMNCCVPWWLTIWCEFRTINSIVKTFKTLAILLNRMIIRSCILQKRQGTFRLAQHQAVRGNIFPVVQKRNGSTKKGFKRNQFTRKIAETIFFPGQCVHTEDGKGLVDQFSVFFPSILVKLLVSDIHAHSTAQACTKCRPWSWFAPLYFRIRA